MELLKINNASKVYNLKNKESVSALNHVSFNVNMGKCIGLVGESGCGKSTLGKLIVGLEQCTQGEILFKNKNVSDISRKDNFRKNLQMVFQDSFSAVNKKKTIFEIITEPMNNFYKLSLEDKHKKVDDLLIKVGIDTNDKFKFPSQFSGGQLQRICIARALSLEPELLVLDEPLSSLDVSVQAQILNLLHDLKEELNLTYILISHDLEAVYYLSDSLVIMYKGKIVETIDNIEYINNLKHPYSIKLLSSSQRFNPRSIEDENIEEVTDLNELVACPYFNRCKNSQLICKTKEPNLVEVIKGHMVACHLVDNFI